jgi:hypothetical protein
MRLFHKQSVIMAAEKAPSNGYFFFLNFPFLMLVILIGLCIRSQIVLEDSIVMCWEKKMGFCIAESVPPPLCRTLPGDVALLECLYF